MCACVCVCVNVILCIYMCFEFLYIAISICNLTPQIKISGSNIDSKYMVSNSIFFFLFFFFWGLGWGQSFSSTDLLQHLTFEVLNLVQH